MSDSVVRPRSKKTENRLVLAAKIRQRGFDMPPCSYCKSQQLSYVVDPAHPKCSECTRRGRSCDTVGFSPSALRRVLSESERIELEEEEAKEQLAVLAARIARLSKQRRQLRERGEEMARRGFASLDEMEKADLNAEEARVAGAAAGEVPCPDQGPADLGLSGDIDWNSADWAGLDLGVDLNVGPNVVSPKAGS